MAVKSFIHIFPRTVLLEISRANNQCSIWQSEFFSCVFRDCGLGGFYSTWTTFWSDPCCDGVCPCVRKIRISYCWLLFFKILGSCAYTLIAVLLSVCIWLLWEKAACQIGNPALVVQKHSPPSFGQSRDHTFFHMYMRWLGRLVGKETWELGSSRVK